MVAAESRYDGSMRLAPAIVLAAGCNQLFGIDDTNGSQCLSAPVFKTQPVLVVASCTDYVPSIAANLAVASCKSAISESAVDAPSMTPSSFTPQSMLLAPRLTPEGDQLFARDVVANAIVAYTRSNSTWTEPVVQDVGAVGLDDTVSSPTSTGVRHILHANEQQIDELVETAPGAWSSVHTYVAADFSLQVASTPSLSVDGLRMMFVGKTVTDTILSVYFTQRDVIDDVFALAIRLTGSEARSDPVMSDDCTRMYFDDPSGVQYTER
jgi:hypothetical protein